jgi:hypothetical protein
MANCSFSPSTVTPDSKAATTTATITTAAHTASLGTPPLRRRSVPLYAVWLVLPAILLGTASPKRRKLLSCCLVFLVVGGCLLQAACGAGSNSGSTGTGGTPAGSYTIMITGAAGSTQHTTTVTLTVQ